MNPVSVSTYDVNTSKVVTNHFYNICLTKREDGATVRSIFAAIEKNFDLNNLSFQNCVSLSVDNAMGYKDKNSEIFIRS